MHAEQLHPSPRLSSHSHWVQLHAEQPHPPPRLILLALISCSAARRRNDSAAATDGPFRSPTNQPPPSIHLVSAATPGRHRLSSHLSPSRSDRFCSHSSPAVRRDAETTAQPRPMDPSAHPPTNPHRPSISSPPPPDIVSLLTPRRFPSRLRIRCSSPAPHLAPPCYPMYIYTSLDAKYVLFCVAYALVCAGRAVLYVHARRP